MLKQSGLEAEESKQKVNDCSLYKRTISKTASKIKTAAAYGYNSDVDFGSMFHSCFSFAIVAASPE